MPMDAERNRFFDGNYVFASDARTPPAHR